MIESGTLVPGIDVADFGLPPGTALRVERPAADLRPLLSGYTLMDSDPAMWTGRTSWSLPSFARLWIPLTDGPISVRPRSRGPAPIAEPVILGPSSRGMPVTSHGGVSVLVEIPPAGWARWFGVPADRYRDRVTPLAQLWPAPRIADLMARLDAMERETPGGAAIKPTLDAVFAAHLPPPHPDEAIVTRACAFVIAGEITQSSALGAALGLNPHALRRIFAHYFGFTPKLVLRRTRFVRALAALIVADARPDFACTPDGYHDIPHFLRDAADFLDLTPRRFLALPLPYLRALLRARSLVLGAPTPLLDQVPGGH